MLPWSGRRDLVYPRTGSCFSSLYHSFITGILVGCCSRISRTSPLVRRCSKAEGSLHFRWWWMRLWQQWLPLSVLFFKWFSDACFESHVLIHRSLRWDVMFLSGEPLGVISHPLLQLNKHCPLLLAQVGGAGGDAILWLMHSHSQRVEQCTWYEGLIKPEDVVTTLEFSSMGLVPVTTHPSAHHAWRRFSMKH